MNNVGYQNIEAAELVAAPWRTTYIVRPDLKLLATSMNRYGWIFPLVACGKSGDGGLTLIDGHERLQLAKASPQLMIEGKFVPVVVFPNLSETEAMIMHVTMNRARGQVMNARLSGIVRTIVNSGAYDRSTLMQMLGMTAEEFQILLDGSLVKMRKVSEHVYSKAWVPIEAGQDEKPQFERPPNPDR